MVEGRCEIACFTEVLINLDDNTINRLARKHLGLRETGSLSEYDAKRVRVEAGVLTAIAKVRRLNPTAVIRRKGNELTVTVST